MQTKSNSCATCFGKSAVDEVSGHPERICKQIFRCLACSKNAFLLLTLLLGRGYNVSGREISVRVRVLWTWWSSVAAIQFSCDYRLYFEYRQFEQRIFGAILTYMLEISGELGFSEYFIAR